MEDMIKQIMDIDKEAYDLKRHSEKMMQEAEENLGKELELITKGIITSANEEATKKYQIEIEEVTRQIEKKDIGNMSIMEEIEQRYRKSEEQLCEELFANIFSLEE